MVCCPWVWWVNNKWHLSIVLQTYWIIHLVSLCQLRLRDLLLTLPVFHREGNFCEWALGLITCTVVTWNRGRWTTPWPWSRNRMGNPVLGWLSVWMMHSCTCSLDPNLWVLNSLAVDLRGGRACTLCYQPSAPGVWDYGNILYPYENIQMRYSQTILVPSFFSETATTRAGLLLFSFFHHFDQSVSISFGATKYHQIKTIFSVVVPQRH